MLEEDTRKKMSSGLTGCTLDQVLYFVSQEHPVLPLRQTGVVIITGYDDFGNTILLDAGGTETYFYGPQDSLGAV